MITKTHAIAIAAKLEAERKSGARHELAIIRHNGVIVAHFPIQNGSRNDQGHDHLPGYLHVTANECLRLGACTMQRQEWLERMEAKGLLE